MSRINYSNCPACGSNSITKQFAVKDFTVSGETFEIFECSECTLRFTQNVPDQSEIGSYYQASSYISHTDTREGIINKVYHSVRKFTLGRKQKLIESIVGKKSGTLLDIGAGTGAFANHMEKAGWKVTGLEPDASTRKRAMEIHEQKLLPADDLFTLDAESFDAITMWHVLEHVHPLHEYLEQMRKLLSQHGVLFIAVPNYLSYDGTHFREYWAAYDVPRHLYHFSAAAMNRLLKKHNMQVTDLKPMWFDSFYVSMLSEQYKRGTPANASAFLQGLKSNIKALGNPANCSSIIYIAKKI